MIQRYPALIIFLTLIGATVSQAATLLNHVAGTTQIVPGISVFKTTGELMEGMKVTAYFSGAAPETAVWAATAVPDEGAVVGPAGDWNVSQLGDTFHNFWKIQYQQAGKGLLTGLRFDGMPAGPVEGATVFDCFRDFSGDILGTPGSELGRDFRTDPDPYPGAFDILATYSDQVKVDSDVAGPRGDLYRSLEIRFSLLDVPLTHVGVAGLGGSDLAEMVFRQDTDNLSMVPEPAGVILVGLAGLGLTVGRSGRCWLAG